jgi:glucose-fructose oxidoreductase
VEVVVVLEEGEAATELCVLKGGFEGAVDGMGRVELGDERVVAGGQSEFQAAPDDLGAGGYVAGGDAIDGAHAERLLDELDARGEREAAGDGSVNGDGLAKDREIRVSGHAFRMRFMEKGRNAFVAVCAEYTMLSGGVQTGRVRVAKMSWLAVAALVLGGAIAQAQDPISVALVGMEHGHTVRVYTELSKTSNVKLVAVIEKDPTLRKKYGDKFHVEPSLFYDSLDAMAAAGMKPKALLLYGPALQHLPMTEWGAKHGMDVMMEKPFATTLADAVAMRDLGRKYHTRVLVNYETTWYSSGAEVMQMVESGKLGEVHKVIIHDGNKGPGSRGTPPEFFAWLTDPIGNGAGALFDFGCYGADLMTVMMHGEMPLSVTAVAQTDQPQFTPKVDDDATVILRYPHTQAVLMPSWQWPVARKDMEVYGTGGEALALDPTMVTKQYSEREKPVTAAAPALPLAYTNSLEYLAALERGEIKGDHDLTSVETNIGAMQILDAARRSVKEGRTVTVTPVPK